mgnify:CR=1 FL=1
MLVAAAVLGLGFPRGAAAFGWGRAPVIAGWVVAGLLLLAGGFSVMFRDSFKAGAVTSDAKAAAEDLRRHYPLGPKDVIRRAAVRVLLGAFHSSGPITVDTYDVPQMVNRLGPALDYVKAVERFLVQQQKIYRVFTHAE